MLTGQSIKQQGPREAEGRVRSEGICGWDEVGARGEETGWSGARPKQRDCLPGAHCRAGSGLDWEEAAKGRRGCILGVLKGRAQKTC